MTSTDGGFPPVEMTLPRPQEFHCKINISSPDLEFAKFQLKTPEQVLITLKGIPRPNDLRSEFLRFNPRLDSYGGPLPLARHIRTTALATGTRPDLTFTQLATHFFVFTAGDITTVHDSVDYVVWRPYCCLPKGKSDPMCIPQKIPEDDPVHRFSHIRCQNLTRPITYQSSGCVNNKTLPDKISSSTPTFDLSIVYGAELKEIEKARLGTGGLLKYEVDEGRIYPPRTKTLANVCLLNQPPRETRCHDTPAVGANSILGINLFAMWFWRNHNRMALTLAELNPCWTDEKLYQTARDINIATELQLYLYEFLPVLLGKVNLLRDSVISADGGFRDMYDSKIFPTQTSEYPYVLRWVHLMQEGRLKMYDTEGNYLKQVPIVNVTLRTGFLAIDDNLDYITQGSFRQASGKIDYTVDPDVGERIFGGLQHMSDVATNDLAKGRYFGFPPYVKYRKFCSGKTINSFDDLTDIIAADKLELLKDLYRNVNDIDLMAGIWLEQPVFGGFAPPTFYCVVVEQLLRSIKSDRHWYERPNRPHAFTKEQLQEIRKVSVSRLLCDVGDKVTRIQPRGFLRAGPAGYWGARQTTAALDGRHSTARRSRLDEMHKIAKSESRGKKPLSKIG
ncbi:hypothetical protein MSG28_007786 [Choristoneura fumiferana]|uniref:Uncharacterized protein n=1 Tax=Choristoneura fumiferana TaxID=7141 RepID=A0ACC0JYU4_CHOFU|nr:hypothetical protein MSG28_007786 [Choristoneura fumiferana]